MATTTSFENSVDANPAWTPYAEGEQFMDDVAAQSGTVYLRTVGQSVLGKDLRMAAVGYPNAPTDQELRDKSVVFIVGVTHGDEPSGREASFQKLRDLAFTTDPAIQDYLSKHPVIFIPSYNADSIGTSRTNANGEDLNRQLVSYTEPEPKALGTIFVDYNPHIVIDCHQNNLADSAQVGIDFPLNSQVDTDVVNVSDTLHTTLKSAAVTAGYTSETYDVAGSSNPRMLVLSSGLRNMLSILIEVAGNTSPLALSRKDGTDLCMALFTELFAWHNTNSDLVRSTVANARYRARQAGEDKELIVFPNLTETFAGYELTEVQYQTVQYALQYGDIKWYTQRSNGLRFIPLGQPMFNFIPSVVGNNAGSSGDSDINAARLADHPALLETTLRANIEVMKTGSADLDKFVFLADSPHEVGDLESTQGYEWRIQSQRGGMTSTSSEWEAMPQSTAADTTPSQFTFTDQTDVAVSTIVESNAVTVLDADSGVDIPISVTGGEYAVSTNGGVDFTAYTSVAGNVRLNDQVKVRHTSSSSNSTTVNTILDIGGVTDTFSSTTAAEVQQAPQGTVTVGQFTVTSSSATAPVSYSDNDADSFEYQLGVGNWITFVPPLSISDLGSGTNYSGQARVRNEAGTSATTSFSFQTAEAGSGNPSTAESFKTYSPKGPARSGRPPRRKL